MSRVDPPSDSALLREVRHWLALAVEDLGFGVAVAEAGSERILFANRYAKQVWRRLAQTDGVAGGYRKQVEVSGVHPRFSSYWKREASDGELHAGHGDRGGHPAASN